jgi:periplasmic protein TonB
MKTKRSFLLSAVVHAGIITGAIALTAIPQEKEEEVVLELSLAEPTPLEPQPQTVAKQVSKPTPQEMLQPSQKLPIVEQAKIVEEIKQQPETKEALEESKPMETPQLTHMEPKITPITPIPQPVNVEEQYLDDHLSTIRDILVKYRKYPSQAVRLKQEGSVKVTFRLKQNGEVEDVRVVSSSGHEILDEDALKLIQKTVEYFPKPPKSVRITVPLNYALKIRT